ncbi:MAG: nucleoside deaminase [Bacteroidia bacterium]|nr:nucleoside deaminase [Bacteroidia bacterium]
MKSKDELFLHRAVELAQQGMQNNEGGPFGALIVKDDEIISEGINKVTSNNDPTAHAEILAIRKACEKLNRFHLDGYTLYTSCEPCPMCFGAIYWSKIKRVVFASTREDADMINFNDNFIYRELELPIEKRSIEFNHIPLDEALSLLKNWVNKEDRTEY